MSTPLVVLLIGLVLAIPLMFFVVIPKIDRVIRRRYSPGAPVSGDSPPPHDQA